MVSQEAETISLRAAELPAQPLLWALANAFHQAVETALQEQFIANEITLMRYPLEAGISPHRDHQRYKKVIAAFSLTGLGNFQVLGDRQGEEVLHQWLCAPGDLVLLRAPGLKDYPQERLLHSIEGLSKNRASLTLRMNSEA